MSIRVWGGLAADKRDKTRGKQPQRDVFHRLNYQENTSFSEPHSSSEYRISLNTIVSRH